MTFLFSFSQTGFNKKLKRCNSVLSRDLPAANILMRGRIKFYQISIESAFQADPFMKA
jgi:hypothetical protein